MEFKKNWKTNDCEVPIFDERHKPTDQRILVTLKQYKYIENHIREYKVKLIKTKKYHKSITLCPSSPHPKTLYRCSSMYGTVMLQ